MAESSSLTVALTGGTGFVGRHTLPRLRDAGHRVRALVRDPDKLGQTDSGVTPVRGDLFDADALAELCDGADAVVHLVGIIEEKPERGQTFQRVHVEGARNLLGAASRAGGVKRWVHMSALGSRPGAEAEYHQTKWQAEQLVRQSGIPYVIFRPSIIHGPDGEFMRDLVKPFVCNRFPPFMPYFARGVMGRSKPAQLQPVYVQDVARCFAAALTNEHATGETYPLGGPDRMTLPQMYEIAKKHLPGARQNKKAVGIPAWYAKMIAPLPGVPFNTDQVIMALEGSTCDTGKVTHDFEIQLAPFEETFAEYATVM